MERLMKNNKGILLVLFGVLFIAAPAFAQSSIEHPFSGMIKSGTTVKTANPADLVEFDALELTEDDTNPTCAAGNYNLYADLSETAIKVCQNGTATIIGTGASVQQSINAWNIESSAFLQSFSTTGQDTAAKDVDFKSDGTKMYVLGGTGLDVNEYTLSTAWDVSSASFSVLFDVSGQDNTVEGITFKPDGTKMYMVGGQNDKVYEYDLSTAWLITSASFLQDFSLAPQGLQPKGIFFKPDGTKMYATENAGSEINEYDLSIAWDVTSATFLQVFSILPAGFTPQGLSFKPDGSKVYFIQLSDRRVLQYTLSTLWNITTAVFEQSFNVLSEQNDPAGLFLKPDGTKFYVNGTTQDVVGEYDVGFFLDAGLLVDGKLLVQLATDGDSILAVLENTEPHAAASTNETAQLRFGFGGDLDVARIVVGKEDDYDPGAGENDSFMAFYTDLDGAATQAARFNSDGSTTLAVDLAVTEGGMGAGTFTDGGILLGSGTNPITALGVAANGQIPIGDGATDPVLATITGTADEVDITNGAGSITVGLPANVTVTGTLIANNANHVLEGLSTGRTVLRSISLRVLPGATPGTDIDITLGGAGGSFNAPTINAATDLAKSGSSGSFALSAGGEIITMDITEDIVGSISATIGIHDINSSSTTELYVPSVAVSGTSLSISVFIRGTQVQSDWTTIMDAGDLVDINVAFITSS